MSEIKEILDIVKDAKKILITSHINPDYDAVGSSLGLYWILKSLTKSQVDMVFEDDTPELDGKIFMGYDRIQKRSVAEAIKEYDTIFLLDAINMNRFSRENIEFNPSQKVILIDHHQGNTNIEPRIYIHPPATSTAEIVFDLFKDEADISIYIARPLMLGLYADSGGFTYRGVSKKTFEIAAKLSEYGADSNEIAEIIKVYNDKVFKAIKLVIANISFDDKHKYAYTYVPRQDYDQLKLNSALIDDVIGHVVDILIGRKGYNWGLLIKPDRPGMCKVSFRSRTSGENVRFIAEFMDGGGHDQAAGATINNVDDPYEALGFVRNKIDEYYKKSK